MPLVEPPGMLHARPMQQSAPEVQVPPCPWQLWGEPHVPAGEQMSEQHWEAAVQLPPFGLQAVPPSGAVPPSPETAIRHALLISESGRHWAGAQQLEEPGTQVVPTGSHEDPVHR